MKIGRSVLLNETGEQMAAALYSIGSALWREKGDIAEAVVSLDNTKLSGAMVIEAVGIPDYVEESELPMFAEYGLTRTGWYVFARIPAKGDTVVTADTTVSGAEGVVMTAGSTYLDVAVRFEVAAQSQSVVIDWGDYAETYVFKATDLAVRNLDYRTTFYVYDIAPYVTWEYALTTDEKFVAGSHYYTKDGDVYTEAVEGTDWTADADIPANTYYKHSKVRFEGMTRNITYKLNIPIDCPVEIVLPEIPDDGYGAWFEIQVRALGSFSITPEKPEDVQMASNTLAWTAAGIYYLDFHYANVAGLKIWRCVRTSFNVNTNATT